MVYNLWLDEHDRRWLERGVNGNLWTTLLVQEYRHEIMPTGMHDISGSLLICTEDTEILPGAPYPFFTIERGGSYAYNIDLLRFVNYTPGSDLRLGPSADYIVVPSDHVLFWDSGGFRSRGDVPSTVFHRNHLIPTSLPDPRRHLGNGNILYLDAHVESKKSDEIEVQEVRWDHKAD
ncbi:MAG TPA: hypothetical protein VF184_06365 [Phycisphaeraceae bacterium]